MMTNFNARFTRFALKSALLLSLASLSIGSQAQTQANTNSNESWTAAIYKVESGAYPYVQAYVRTFNQDRLPLTNLNYANIGLLVKGKIYSPRKQQYSISTLQQRDEAIRVVFVFDTSKTMAGAPFTEAVEAAARFIDIKRPQDQVAIIGLDDSKPGYELTSGFDSDNAALGRRLADLTPTSQTTRLYDGIGAAMQQCHTSGSGGISSSQATYVASCSIVVFSDGKDEGSALARSDVMTRISNAEVPTPIYSLAYSKLDKAYLRNMLALSENSLGKYYDLSESLDQMTRTIEEIQRILQNDYVIVFRAYTEIDGASHPFKVGFEYPSGSGRYRYASGEFEAIDSIPNEFIMNFQAGISKTLGQDLGEGGTPFLEKKSIN